MTVKKNAPEAIAIARLRPNTPAFRELVEKSRREGYWMLVRLDKDWQSGGNRFRKRSETLLGATIGGRLVGVCGLNLDPYFPGPGQGRVRHLYVEADWRRRGVGRALVESIIDKAREHFTVLNVRAPQEAFAFYESLRFLPVAGAEFLTHRMVLSKAAPHRI